VKVYIYTEVDHCEHLRRRYITRLPDAIGQRRTMRYRVNIACEGDIEFISLGMPRERLRVSEANEKRVI